MKKLFVLFIISSINTSLFLDCVSAQCDEPFSTYTFSALDMSSVNVVKATTLNGSLTVNGDANSETVVKMYISRNGSLTVKLFRRTWTDRTWTEEEIKQHLAENYVIEVNVIGEELLVAARQKNNERPQINISFQIMVPRQMNSDLKTTNGSVQISNLTGSHKLETVNGSLKVANLSGKVNGNTTNGSITVTNSNDDINLSTVNGSITVTNSSDVINLSTVNGSITETGCSWKINLTTVNGKVKRQ